MILFQDYLEREREREKERERELERAREQEQTDRHRKCCEHKERDLIGNIRKLFVVCVWVEMRDILPKLIMSTPTF